MDIIAKKGKSGWRAENIVEFDGPRKLAIETYKYDGAMISRATVNTYGDLMMTHVFGLGGGGDFSERLIVTRPARGTAKAIVDQHAKALQQLLEIVERARAHYVKFPPRKD